MKIICGVESSDSGCIKFSPPQAKIENNTVNDFARARAKRHTKTAKAIEKRIEHMEKLERPRQNFLAQIVFEGSKSSRIIAKAENLSKGYNGRLLYSDVNFTITAGEKVGIMGENGSSKTTLLKMLQGLEKPDTGETYLTGVSTGYFSQIFDQFDEESTALKEMEAHSGLDTPNARQILAYFLFFRDQVFKKIKNLSIGERSRLALACIKASEPEALILDEPTGHLDVDTTEILEKALKDYGGTIIIVTHDRFMLNSLADKLLVIENCKINTYLGNFDYYQEKKIKGGFAGKV